MNYSGLMPLTISLIFVLCSIKIQGQEIDQNTQKAPKLMLDFPLADFPYLSYSSQSRANYRAGTTGAFQSEKRVLSDYLGFAESPSMNQAIGWSTSLYNSMNYGVAEGWNAILNPTKGKSARVWNRVLKELTAGVLFAATTKIPFAGGWAHEEFHRNTWTQYGIGSYNEIWDFNLAPDALSYVSHVYDEDLSWLKANHPADYVRMGSAGIEAHFLTNEVLQQQDFEYNTNLPNIALYWADVIAPLDYVNRAKSSETNEEHAKLYDPERNILRRDFTGNDFTGWVYDLFRPKESFESRGSHPTGVGVDRYRTYDDLDQEMLDYLEKMGTRQLLNFISPFMIGIRHIKFNDNFRMNFAVRHYLTSFGDDIQLEFYYQLKESIGQLVLHRYSNHNIMFPGIESTIDVKRFELGGAKKLSVKNRTMVWIQPKDQEFMTNTNELGGLISFSAHYENKTVWRPYVNVEAKSNGWVAGNPYLSDKMSVRLGIRALIGMK